MKKIVLLAMALLAIALIIPSTRATLMDKASPVTNKVRAMTVPSALKAIADQLDARMKRGEKIPTPEAWSNWLQKSYTGVPEDPWGHEFYLLVGRRDFTVGSMGPDGVRGSADDMKESRPLPGQKRRR